MKEKYIYYLAALLIIFSLINYINSWNTDNGPDVRATIYYIIALVGAVIYAGMILIKRIKTRKSTETIIEEDKKYFNSIWGIATILFIIAWLIICVLNNR
jgi:predicted Co/Zn/Cd cation transporter (cation efflux family)